MPEAGDQRRPDLRGRIATAIIASLLVCLFGGLPWALARVPDPVVPIAATAEAADAAGAVGGAETGTQSESASRRAGPRRYARTDLDASLLPPWWAPHAPDEADVRGRLREQRVGRGPRPWLGTDRLGRDLLARCVVGGVISVGLGAGAAAVATVLGTIWGAGAGAGGPRVDAILMRTVDVLQGLPTILLVVLVALAADGLVERLGVAPGGSLRTTLDLLVLLLAIGGVSWLTMSRVIRSRTLSLVERPFMEASRAAGIPGHRRFLRHLLPNLAGTIVVYASLTVPAAILSESFLSFLGLGVRPPMPSWGSLAADGVAELNPVRPRWWLLVFPCGFVAGTLLAMHAAGERLRRRVTGAIQ